MPNFTLTHTVIVKIVHLKLQFSDTLVVVVASTAKSSIIFKLSYKRKTQKVVIFYCKNISLGQNPRNMEGQSFKLSSDKHLNIFTSVH